MMKSTTTAAAHSRFFVDDNDDDDDEGNFVVIPLIQNNDETKKNKKFRGRSIIDAATTPSSSARRPIGFVLLLALIVGILVASSIHNTQQVIWEEIKNGNVDDSSSEGTLTTSTKVMEENSNTTTLAPTIIPTTILNHDEKNDPTATFMMDEQPPERRYIYSRRGQPISDEDRQAMMQTWGGWPFQDDRQSSINYTQFPQRDVPWDQFPPQAWQRNPHYLQGFLNQSLQLVERAQAAILAEYGQSSDHMMELDIYSGNLSDMQTKLSSENDRGGWTTQQSWEGLKRRLLHAIITEDSFIFAMGGHSAAAGHGNHFQQSYSLQVQWILEAVFARLGVRHQARNFGNGGMGTLHNGLGASSIYGPDVDFLMWDSSMTEKESEAGDVFARQAILGGYKVPVLWSLNPKVSIPLHDYAAVDVGSVGTGFKGIRKMNSLEDLNQTAWAAQYVRCSGEMSSLCRENEYSGTCWIERDDFVPSTKQTSIAGKAKWHPGNRKHQLTGRILAYTILSALKEALLSWQEAENYELQDHQWHVSEYYESMKQRVQSLDPSIGSCTKYVKHDLEFACKYPLKARTEFTPRAFPAYTNIRNLMHPSQSSILNNAESNIYAGPDVFNPHLHPPPGEIDVLNIIESGVDFRSISNPDYARLYETPPFESSPKVEIGKGVHLSTKAGDDFCDGTVDSFCGRSSKSDCLLSAQNDGRNGLRFDSYSGWITLNLPNLQHGFIVIKLETWHQKDSVKETEGWRAINNNDDEKEEIFLNNNEAGQTQNSSLTAVKHNSQQRRRLKYEAPEYCDEFRFEYAIDGNITSLTYEEFSKRKHEPQRVVETLTLLNDPNVLLSGSHRQEQREMEVAIRMTGCKREKVFQLTHIYWS